MEAVQVDFFNRAAGILTCDGGKLSFQYDPEYLKMPNATALSHSLPLQTQPFGHAASAIFFENLLPPDEVRKRLGKILHLSRHNIFGFLKAIGGDCAGAVALHSTENVPDRKEKERLLGLSDAEAASILHELPQRPLNLGAVEGFRISGTGAQDKLICRVGNDKIFLPLFGAPSTHIVKPPTAAYPNSVLNELFCMKLARRAGLAAADCSILTIAGTPCYCTTRYDRRYENGGVSRLHQEDFCQLLGVDPENKYESEGGPTIAQCFKMLRELRIGADGQLEFIRRIIFNDLIGNGDAHAKNFSVLYQGKRCSLSPLYDVLSTAIYPALSRESAMSVGGEKKFDAINRESFIKMATDCEVRSQAVLDRLDDLAGTLPNLARTLAAELNVEYPSEVYAKIIDVINKQTARLLPAKGIR